MILEEWASVEGYEGIYEVSNRGRVRRIKGWRGRKATGDIKKAVAKGYEQVTLYKNGHSTRFKVHRLVAQSFIPNPCNKQQVNHIDGDKRNNVVSNLEWVTQSENMTHAKRTGLSPITTPAMQRARSEVGQKTRNIERVNPPKAVIVKRKDGTQFRFGSLHEAAKEFGISATNVLRYCKSGEVFKREEVVFEYEG